MNLMNLLIKTLTSSGTVDSLTGKTGASAAQIVNLISKAIPVLIGFLTKNASSADGLASLANALTQHTGKEAMDRMVADSDEEDGGKIVGHILGDQSEAVVKALADETELSTDQVNRSLSSIAPAFMSALSAASGSAAGDDGKFDLTDLMGMFGGAVPTQGTGGILGGLGNLLGGLFGGSSDQKPEEPDTVNLLSGFLGEGNATGLGGLMSTVLGGSSSESGLDGDDLLKLLAGFLK